MSEKDDDKVRDKTVIAITDKVNLKNQISKQEPYLIQISGRETGQMVNLSGRKIKLGRDPLCEIVLDDQHISRIHAEIDCRSDSEIWIRDLGSTNGIFVNGHKATETQLNDGDKILVGTRMYFKFCFQDAVEQNYQQNLFRAANIDSLTQLYNKKYFMDVLFKEFSFSKRNGFTLSLLMMDIDFFKKVNDTHGHLAGDQVLRFVGQYLHKHIRMENICCRYGGEEFAVILRNVDDAGAFQIAERIRKGIEQDHAEYRGKQLKITVSLGIATLDSTLDTAEDLIRKADEHLYEAKERGRNQIIVKKAA